MRRPVAWALVAALWLWLAVALISQSAPRLQWTHDGVNTTRFEYVIDGGDPVSLGLPTPEGTTYTVPLPAMAAGTHTLVVRACNNGLDAEAGTADDVCTDSQPITVVKL